MLQLDSCLEIAKSAALLAGKYIKDHQNQDLEILLNEGRDIKLQIDVDVEKIITEYLSCLLYTSPSPRDGLLSRMPSSA